MTEHEHDYDLSKKVKIDFKGMDYFIMPRYQDHYIQHDYERFSLQILKNDLDSNSLFVDIGAHYGAYSMYAANESSSNVLAIEPVKENFSLLSENIKANNLNSLIKAHEYAASDENGEAEFNIPWASDSAGFYQHPNADTIRTQKVIVKKIDDVIDGKKVDLIKIDTEGHEIGVINGLKKSLRDSPQAKLIIELNPPLLESAGTNAMELLETVRDLGKEIYMVDEDKFTLYRITDCLEKWPQFINEGNYANLYCVPAKNHQYLMFISHSSQLGGAEIAMFEQICALTKRGILSHVVLPETGPIVELLIEKGISHSVNSNYSFWIGQESQLGELKTSKERNFNNINASIDIVELAKNLNPTVIVNNSLVNPWGYVASQSLSLPLVWMVHEYGDLDHGLLLSHGAIDTRRFVVSESDLVISCSEAVKRSLDAASKGNTHTVYNLIDINTVIEKSKEEIKNPFLDKKSTKLCIVGTISEGKGQKTVIEAIDLLKGKGKSLEVVFLGSGIDTDLRKIKESINKHNLSKNVHLLGFINNPYPYMKNSDAIVVASKNEAFGRVTAEAMILGVPVIASNIGGSIEMIVDGKTGFLFEPQNPKALADALARLIAETKDQKLKITTQAERHILSLLDTDRNADKLAKLITELKVDSKRQSIQPLMTTEWIDTIRVYKEQLQHSKNENLQLSHQAEGQKQINLELQQALQDLRKSQSYKVGRKLAKAKNVVKHPTSLKRKKNQQ